MKKSQIFKEIFVMAVAPLLFGVAAFILSDYIINNSSRLEPTPKAAPSIETQLATESARTTSFVPKANPQATIIFGGDLMFDRYIRRMALQSSYSEILADLTTTLSQADLVVANLEGPITDNKSVSMGTEIGSTANYIFSFDPQIASVLKQNNISLVSLGNNHIFNFGKAGLESTISTLQANNIDYFGYTGKDHPNQFLIKKINGLKIAFVSYNQFIDGGFDHTLETINLLKNQSDFIVVYAHWGNEYQLTANQVIVDQGHQLIDNGADLVIGSHPHVIEQSEIYNQKYIYYSLGNFVFDQYFNEDTMHGLLLETKIGANKQVQVKEIPIKMLTNGKTVLEDAPKTQKMEKSH